jgi:regulator of sigma D
MAKGGDMGDKNIGGPLAQKEKEKNIENKEEINKIKDLMVKFSKEPSYELYQKLKELRGTGPKPTDEYKEAWDQFSNSNKKDVNKFSTLFKFYNTLSD